MRAITYPDPNIDLHNSKDLEQQLKIKCLSVEDRIWLENAFKESFKQHENTYEVIALFKKILEPYRISSSSYINIDRALADIVLGLDDNSRLILTKLPILRDRFLTKYQGWSSEAGRVLYLTFYPNWDEHSSKKPSFLIDILLEDEYLRKILFSWDKEKSLAFLIDYRLNKLIYDRTEHGANDLLDASIIKVLKMISDYQLLSAQDKYDKSRIIEIKNRCKSNNTIMTLCNTIINNPCDNPKYEEIELDFYVPPTTKKSDLAKQSIFSKTKADTYLGFEPGFLMGKRF